MPQVFWATCPDCGVKFTAEKAIWDHDDPLLCPNCQIYFTRMESPLLETIWPVTFQDIKNLGASSDRAKKNS